MPDIDNITPNENPSKELDRFFVQVRPGADEPELQVEATVEANVELEGRIGFLAVEVVGDAIAPDLNMKMTGRLKVTAETTDSALEAEGTIAINWPNVCPLGVGECVCPAGPGECTEPVITADLDFDDKLKLFDTDPSIFGWHTGTGSAPDEPSAVLIDSTRDFNLVRDVVGRTLLNITDGTSCMVTGIADPHTLECVMGANTLMEWNPPDPDVPGDSGDRYEVVGNPFDDPNSNDVVRTVALFDVQAVNRAPVDPGTSGSDMMFGDEGRDWMFGQGNTEIDDDPDWDTEAYLRRKAGRRPRQTGNDETRD